MSYYNVVGFSKAIRSLGTTAQTVTVALRAKGIKGIPNNPCACPIARYLKTFGFSTVSVTGSYVSFYNDREGTTIKLPKTLRDWVYDFDMNNYPEFVDR